MNESEQQPVDNRTMPPCSVIPELAYQELAPAVEWLCTGFGFSERWRAGDHRAQLAFGSGAIVVAEARSSNVLSGPQSVMVRVDDVDAHHERARAHGARVLREPLDFPYGERQYSVEDPGGHHWTFSQSIADLPPEAWGGVAGPALRRDSAGGAISISVMLIVPKADAAVAWYREALGATELWNLGGVAGLEIHGAPFFIHESNHSANPAEGAPREVGATSTRIELFVEDPDAVLARAVTAGATPGAPISTEARPWGEHRQGGFRDPFGHTWSVGDRSPLRRVDGR